MLLEKVVENTFSKKGFSKISNFMPIEQALEQWGLSPKETKIYLAGLELGAVPVQDIAKKTGIERTNVYSILEGLIHQGLFMETEKSGKKYFIAESPEKLVLRLKEREKEIENVLPELKSIYNLSPQKPKVRFYEGVEGVRNFIENIRKERLSYWHIDPDPEGFVDLLGKEFSERIFKLANDLGLKRRIITTPNSWLKNAPEGLLRVRFLPEKVMFHTRLYILGDLVGIILIKKEPMIVIIEDKEINEFFKFMFENIWNQCKPET